MTPQDFIMKKFMQGNNNPILKNLIDMIQNGNSKGVENFARNIMKENGRDFDKEFSTFMKQFKG